MRDVLTRPERPSGVGCRRRLRPKRPPPLGPGLPPPWTPLERALWTARPDPRSAFRRRGLYRACCDVPAVLPEAGYRLAELWCSLPPVSNQNLNEQSTRVASPRGVAGYAPRRPFMPLLVLWGIGVQQGGEANAMLGVSASGKPPRVAKAAVLPSPTTIGNHAPKKPRVAGP
ncbi:hypothetical protein MTO96_002718 [Rhipicephalus appendiculatus]